MKKNKNFSLFPLGFYLFSLLFYLLPFTYLHSLSLDDTLNTLRPLSLSAGESLEFRWDPFFRDGMFNLGRHYGAFSAASAEGENGLLMLDSRDLYTVPLPYNDSGELVFPQAFVDTLKDAFTRSLEHDASRFRIAAIIIDPGHGGRDPGAIATPVINGKQTTMIEKDIVLKVSKDLKILLDRLYPDKRIMITRETDIFLSLEERVAIANSVSLKENEAIIYISVHANRVFNQNVRGYEVWHLNPEIRRDLLDPSESNDSADILAIRNAMLEEEFTTESIILAQSILRSLGQTLGNSVPSRGIKNDQWFVIKNSRMPAVLVELGFISNSQDALIMNTESGLKSLVDALYKGIVDFVGIFERSGGFTAAP
ncbi:MAG: N-acetylmuramoyl-L-alanine amidase [Treponema sp.]|nr:N-acetylmuramoyl-L-alanine amidase [Treponema sp.]